MNIIARVDKFLNNITMYKLVLYGLCILAGIAIIFGFIGFLPYSGMSLIYSALILLFTCYWLNELSAYLLKIPANTESAPISALILFFIMIPARSWADVQILLAVAVLATLSKYLVAPLRRHIFNPVAFAVLLVGLYGIGSATWWVGTVYLLPLVLVLGLLIVRKIRRFRLVISFVIVALITVAINAIARSQGVSEVLGSLQQNILSYPLIFFGTIMLTEPLTTPPTRGKQMVYGAIVGVLFGTQFSLGPVYSTPELALIIGNIFSYIVSFKDRLILTLNQKVQVAKDLYEFSFKSDHFLYFAPGQYMEWTIKERKPDSRGNRRYFTIASSPTEDTVKLGVKIMPEGSSAFKTALMKLNVGDTIVAGQLSGDFTLPRDPKQKCVFIAGGIGVTPFRSMVKYLVDRDDRRGATLFYSIKSPDEIAYKELWAEAEQHGIKTIPVVSDKNAAQNGWQGKVGFIDAQMIQSEVPDYKHSIFYISGPGAMVDAYKKMLREMGISHSQIKTDYFPGF